MRTRLLPESEAIILAGAGRAILLQLASPAVGYGVARHSDFASNPMGRLHGTLMYVYAVMAGTPSDRAAASTYVTRMHGPVHGPGDGDAPAPPYDANDPGLQLWVAATLYDTAITVHDRVLGRLPEADADAAYSRYASLGSALRMPRDLWPSDRAAFRRYWQETVETLSVDDVVRAQADALWRATEAPLWVRSLMPLMRFLTAGLLPERVRAEYRMAWDARSQRRFDRLWSVVVPVYAALPTVVRRWPQQYYLRRLRRLTAPR
ncbi:oxygenase MpaB family protein [Frondihabitans cladoniiphilus]|uniref:Oxygenase MpaB family protein n=1 Tax=Frondihabitans cladoniiphilus TaxID=715785 RepID=A0ABP8WC46_9MICO